MWNDILDNNVFIKNLYNKIPELDNVRISELKLLDEGDKVSIIFDLPRYADNPPKKWEIAKYNTVVVEVDFFEIKELYVKSLKRELKGNIKIISNSDNTISLVAKGSVEIKITAVAGLIQSVRGYCNQV